MKVLIAVSGTGGHVYPGIAVAEELRARHPDLSILFATARGKPGADWILRAGFEVRPVPIRGVARRPSLTWLALPFWIAAGCFAVMALLIAESPNLVVGTGGYVSGPVIAFASLLRIPTMVLEQNSIPGVATKLGSLVAREVHVTFPETRERLPRKGRVVVSGNPVRRSVENGDAAAFRRAHDVPASAPLVLVMGGSQGARAVTAAAIGAAKELGEGAGLAMVVQTGARGIDDAGRAAAGAPSWLRVLPYLDDVGGAYAAAALFVGRAGATTLAELAACAVPSILVPYPYAAEDHQTKNARRLEAAGAARVIPERELGPAVLAGAIGELVADGATRARMSEAVRTAGFGGARERVARSCETLLGIG
jgi:UDP-N-acetylglucosamine--N-acetylmuramyl-(pentapeptide) pyrophosphoryl-undecaprenol N-acetylglucosamine transferase